MVKICVIGASFGGLAAGITLLKKGHDVTFIEATEHPAPHTTGGYAEFWFKNLDFSVPPEAVAAPIYGARIVSPHGEEAVWTNGKVIGGVLHPEKFVGYYMQVAERLGGKFVAPAKFHSFRNGQVEYVFGGEILSQKADYLVAADGANSSVRRFLGLPQPKDEDMHLGYEETIQNSHYDHKYFHLYLDREIAERGYWWVFSNNSDGKTIRVGLGVPKSVHQNPKDNYHNILLKKHPEFDLQPLRIVAGHIPTAKVPDSNVIGNILFVGDSGFYCSPLTGGGLALAILSGVFAARAIDSGRVSEYDKETGKEMRPLLKRHFMLKKLLYSWNDKQMDKFVRAMSTFDVGPLLDHADEVNPNRVLIDLFKHIAAKEPTLVPKLFLTYLR